MIVTKNLKKYIGAIESEDTAGTLYDKYSIIIQGLHVSLTAFVSFRTYLLSHHIVDFLTLAHFV